MALKTTTAWIKRGSHEWSRGSLTETLHLSGRNRWKRCYSYNFLSFKKPFLESRVFFCLCLYTTLKLKRLVIQHLIAAAQLGYKVTFILMEKRCPPPAPILASCHMCLLLLDFVEKKKQAGKETNGGWGCVKYSCSVCPGPFVFPPTTCPRLFPPSHSIVKLYDCANPQPPGFF